MLSVIKSQDQLCVSLQQVKAHLRLDHCDDDDYLAFLIKGATAWLEDMIGSPLLSTSYLWQTTVKTDPAMISLPKQNIICVKRVSTLGCNGKSQTIPYKIEDYAGQLSLSVYRCISNLEVEFTAGFGDRTDNVPASLRQALINHVVCHYESRTGIDRQDYLALMQLIQPYIQMGLS